MHWDRTMELHFDEQTVRAALKDCWSFESAKQWTAENPAAGQCNVTAAVIHDLFGGDILRTKLPEGYHYYNRINGVVVDLADSQFAKPIEYANENSSLEAAMACVSDGEYEALRTKLVHRLASKRVWHDDVGLQLR